MTVQTQIQQALASAQSVEASLTQFSLETKISKLRKRINSQPSTKKALSKQLQTRYDQIPQEEPQFQK